MEARCALNMSRADVARQLRLKQELIAAIEEDRIAELPAPIYVLGYLKNYAKLLKLPHEPVVDAYQQLRVEAPEIINEIVKPQVKGAGGRIVKWGTVVIVLVLLAGFISWLQTQQLSPVKSDSAQSPAVIEPEQAALLVEEPATVKGEAPAEAEEPLVAQAESPSEAVAPTAVAESSATQPTPVENNPITVDDAVAEGDKIVISLRDDCWVEIKDADGETIIYDLLRQGRTHQFYGRAPFNVFFGNARAVNLMINDQAYDVTPHIRGKLARFKLNVAESPE
jgi:cytoskeleton protein RodZ